MKMKIDLSKFKKISQNEDTAVLQHPDGHHFHVSIKALHPGNKKNLDSMEMAEGGEAQNPKLAESKKSPPKSDKLRIEYHKEDNKLDIEPVKPVKKEKIKPEHPVEYQAMAEGGEMAEAEAPSLSPSTAMEAPTPMAPAPMLAQAAPSPSLGSNALQGPQAPTIGGGYEHQLGGIQGLSEAQVQQAQGQAQALKTQAAAAQDLMQDYKSKFKEIDDERKAFQEDVEKAHIDPNRYMGSRSTGQKIQSAIALALGGLGQGLIGGSNPAMDFLDKQIERDIDAQKAELGKKETLLSANYKRFGNLKDATDMTRIMQNDMMINQIKQAEARAATPMAKARAQQMVGQLESQIAPLAQQMATRQMLQSGKGLKDADPAKLIPSVVPEKEQPAAFKELQEAQNMSSAKVNILDAFNELAKLNTVSNRLTSPVQTARQVAAIKDPLVAGLSKATAGRFTEQDSKFLDSLFPKYGDSDETLAQKKQRIDHLISEKMNFPILNAYGLEPQKFASTSGSLEAKLSPQQQSFAQWAKANPNDPRAALVLKKLGLQ